ncbi:hypothetical protein MKX01_017050 [Papaver californicum]|nr:hypothetical protein MKX01_017050 [Papaver californicum]
MTRLVTLDLCSFQPSVNTSFTLNNPDLGTLTRNLKELRVLWLDGVNISAHGSEWCKAISSSLPKLQVLSLSNCYLSGPFDKSLVQLQSLYELRLNQNNISAEVPEFFNEFRNLTSLHLSSCGLHGKFPERVLQLKTLRSLYMSDNKLLEGFLPEFSENELLQDLVLSDTSFAGELPHSIGNLTFLSRLDLDNCSFNGSIPTSISNLNQLQYLDLSMNHFNGSIPPMGWSENLTDINLSYNQLTGPIPLEWFRLLKLVNLNSKNNSFNGTIPRALFTLPSLRKLELTMNQFTGRLEEFSNGSFSLLETLDMSINNLQGPIPVSFFDLSRLKILTLSSNNFSGTLSLEKFFQKFKNLSSLDLSNNRLSVNFTGDNSTLFPQVGTLKLRSCKLSIFPTFLSNQSRLTYLDLFNNQMKGKIPDWIHVIGAGNLGHLNLSYNFLQDPEILMPPNSFRSLAVLVLRSNLLRGRNVILPPSASVLDYSLNNFTSMIPNISSYLSLTILFSLASNQLTEEIPQSVCQAGYLQVLDLSQNNLNGEIPPCLMSIRNLGVLNLRGNNLNGIIPDTFPENCTLETLDLNRNQSEGPLPTSLVNSMMVSKDEAQSNHQRKILGFKVLQFTRLYYQDAVMVTSKGLDMELNNLTGEIPYQLAQLSFLSVLNLSFNKLVARIPTVPQFQNLESSSFEGNEGLCGPPLSDNCVNVPDLAQKSSSSKDGVDWQFILTGLGFGAGVGMILGPLLFWKTGRQSYSEHLNGILSKILPERLHHKFCDDGRIDAEGQGVYYNLIRNRTHQAIRRQVEETIYETVNGSHEYMIKGYSLAKGIGVGKFMTSRRFTVGGHDWIIRFYPDGDNQANHEYVSLYIEIVNHGKVNHGKVRATFEFKLLDQSGKGKHGVHITSNGARTFNKAGGNKSGARGHGQYMKRSKLERSSYLKDDILRIHCTVGVVQTRVQEEKRYVIPVPPSDMNQNLKGLLESEIGYDITFHVGDEFFKAHKSILAARSPVFRAQFFGLVGNPDKAMLLFLYSDELPEPREVSDSDSLCTVTTLMQHLLAAADFYDVARLKLMYEAKLCEEMTTNTIATTLALAERYQCLQLKTVCLKTLQLNQKIWEVSSVVFRILNGN